MAKLIGLWGYSRSGKTSVAEMLEDVGFERVCMSEIIGRFVAEGEGLLPFYDQRSVDWFKANVPGFHQRQVSYGNAARNTFGREVWANILEEQIVERRKAGVDIIWPNVRTYEDLQLLRKHGGVFVKIFRDGTTAFSALDTELNTEPADHVIVNDAGLLELRSKVGQLLDQLNREDRGHAT